MATNFSPCKGSYVLNQFPSNVMFGMNGFHVSASGAIQGHHGPLVNMFMGLIFFLSPYIWALLGLEHFPITPKLMYLQGSYVGYEGISHQYASAGTKVKVICKGQGQI